MMAISQHYWFVCVGVVLLLAIGTTRGFTTDEAKGEGVVQEIIYFEKVGPLESAFRQSQQANLTQDDQQHQLSEDSEDNDDGEPAKERGKIILLQIQYKRSCKHNYPQCIHLPILSSLGSLSPFSHSNSSQRSVLRHDQGLPGRIR